MSELCGIYKITSPSGRVYIGQSVDIKTRFSKYNAMHCHGQKRLYTSFLKYGVERHNFDIVELCKESDLNTKERHYQDEYFVLGPGGLNCKLTKTNEKSGRHSDETKQKIRESWTGKKLSYEHRQSLRKPKKISDERRKELSNIMSIIAKNEKNRMATSIRMKGNSYTKGKPPVNTQIVLNKESGVYYENIGKAAEAHNIKRSTLGAILRGQNRNKTNLLSV